MAKLRKGRAYRKLKRPYTRISKFRNKSFVRMDPHIKVIRFVMGDPNKKFEYTLNLIAKSSLQIRQEAIEAARQIANRILEGKLGKTGFFFRIRAYPHQVLREKPMATGAGADRTSTGMAAPFGKPIGVAARVLKGSTVFEVQVNESDLDIAKHALKEASYK
ncbi:MAG: 50S ribosomal protein L16, partial [Candidatus Woesearchaeota archaeon]